MMYAGFPSYHAFGLEDEHVPTFEILQSLGRCFHDGVASDRARTKQLLLYVGILFVGAALIRDLYYFGSILGPLTFGNSQISAQQLSCVVGPKVLELLVTRSLKRDEGSTPCIHSSSMLQEGSCHHSQCSILGTIGGGGGCSLGPLGPAGGRCPMIFANMMIPLQYHTLQTTSR